MDSVQFGFVEDGGTTVAIFIVRHMQERFRAGRRRLNFDFVDFEKAFDRVPGRGVMGWAVHGLRVGGWLMLAVMSVYNGAKTVVGAVYGDSGGFEVRVGVQQGSALSPLLLVIVMEALSGEFRVALPWKLLCTDGLVVVAETEDVLLKGLICGRILWRVEV